MADIMGYQAKLYYGAAGSQASTLLENTRDIKYDTTPAVGSTLRRGDGSSVPIKTGEAVTLEVSLTWTMIHDTTDTSLVALLAAAATGAAVALRFIRSSGLLGLDADCVIKASQGAPIEGEETIDFELVALSRASRTPLLNA